jgi:hypothetical protein
MPDNISSYGPKGAAIEKTARSLHAQNLLTDGQLRELTNGTFSQRDFQAASAAIEKAKALPGISQAFKDALQMNGDLVSLRPQMRKDPNEPQMTIGQSLRDLFRTMMQ